MRVFSRAKSLSHPEQYSSGEIFRKNLNCVSALSFIWNKFCVCMPKEVVDKYRKELELSGIPEISTDDIPEGMGYSMHIRGKDYVFPFAKRCPPEGYFMTNYTA